MAYSAGQSSLERQQVFVDTSGFYAYLVANDPFHAQAKTFFEQASGGIVQLISSDYVLDETATLLSARGHRELAPRFLRAMEHSPLCTLLWTDSTRFRAATRIFARGADKKWSFTDCLSFALMEETGLQKALTTDHHFDQAGLVRLLT